MCLKQRVISAFLRNDLRVKIIMVSIYTDTRELQLQLTRNKNSLFLISSYQ